MKPSKLSLKKSSLTSKSSSIPIKQKSRIKRILIGAFFGYISGVVLTYLIFLFFILQLHVSLTKSTWICSILGVILTIGLAFNKDIRCVVVLILPQFFSVKGRSALIAYIFVLAITGPSQNTINNFHVLSESLACEKEQLKTVLEGMLDVVKRPLVAIKNAVKLAIDTMRKTLLKIEKILHRMKDLIIKLLNGIEKAFKWLGSIVNICNKEIGTPFQRCTKIFDDAIEKCRQKLGVLKFLCNVTFIIRAVCYSVKFIDVVCILVDFISDAIVGVVKRRLKAFVLSIKEMFYVSVKFEHKFHFETHASKNLTQVGADILSEIKTKTTAMFMVFGWMEILASLLFLRIVFKAMIYKSKYLTDDRFDNHYLNKDFLSIDKRRNETNVESVLPLRGHEKRKYIKLTSLMLVRAERMKLARSSMFLIISCIQIFSICFTDYSMYWILYTIRYHGRKQAGLEVPPMITINVTGAGFIADIYLGIINAFEPMTENYEVDPLPCLPNPKPPDFTRYTEIIFLVILCWLFLIFEPYGLRLREVIMRSFYPDRSRERAAWLYNNILTKRTSFLTFARRDARRKFLKNGQKKRISFLNWLRGKTNRFWIMRKILGKDPRSFCMLCGTPFEGNINKMTCPRPGCTGKYCTDCFTQLKGTCFMCMEPIEYGDLSDISEEKDSSDEFEEIVIHK